MIELDRGERDLSMSAMLDVKGARLCNKCGAYFQAQYAAQQSTLLNDHNKYIDTSEETKFVALIKEALLKIHPPWAPSEVSPPSLLASHTAASNRPKAPP